MTDTLIAFDLDDTIYKERDFVLSGYRAVAQYLATVSPAFDYNEMLHVMTTAPLNPFDSLDEYITNRAVQQSIQYSLDIPEVVDIYRKHVPDIEAPHALEVFKALASAGYRLAMITDGRTITQLNKIKTLGIHDIIPEENISISESIGGEKFTPVPFERMMKLNPDIRHFVYVGDNPMKDFVWPNRMGWTTVQLLDDGRNVHSQTISVPSPDYLPQIKITSLHDLLTLPLNKPHINPNN